MFETLEFSTVTGLITTVAVVIGVVFGLAQLRAEARNRRDLASIQFIDTARTPEVLRAASRILALPEDADPELVRWLDKEVRKVIEVATRTRDAVAARGSGSAGASLPLR